MVQTSLRTHHCNQLTAQDENTKVSLAGWVHVRRDHGGIIFIDLRDKYGLTQLVFDPEFDKTYFEQAEQLRREDVILVAGVVKKRGEGLTNPKLNTGEIEVFVKKLTIVNKSQTPPFEIDDQTQINEDLRLEYRYLDLRRTKMQRHLALRHQFVKASRAFFDAQAFTEIETPFLIKSTPEGARDYVVPSRINKGKFYALPQSPQLYKQMLMIAGCDRYYQIARCLRDEDLRADRQPEHTQIDFEMSFVTQEDVQQFVEALFKETFAKTQNITIKTPFPVFSHEQAMSLYGCDKPDIRFELTLTDVTDIAKESEFSVFQNVISSGGIVKCINPEADIARKEIDRYIEYAQFLGAKGMAWMRVTENGLESNIAKYFSSQVQKKLIDLVGAKPGSVLFFIADKPKVTNDVLAKLRLKLGEDLGLIDENTYAFCWVNDFPLFSWNEDEKKWDAEHHIFSMPKAEFVDNLEKDPGVVKGDLWDLVLNGWELASGSIRVSNPQLQQRLFDIIGIKKDEAQEKFGFLLKAYQYGGPIHGGMGIGLDRIIALLVGTHDIREVIAFPKNKNAQCPMDESPGEISEQQLKELAISVVKK
ncbi:MAG: aspartate--tRNA ligase [Candidatus Woesearchaeota archaeon]